AGSNDARSAHRSSPPSPPAPGPTPRSAANSSSRRPPAPVKRRTRPSAKATTTAPAPASKRPLDPSRRATSPGMASTMTTNSPTRPKTCGRWPTSSAHAPSTRPTRSTSTRRGMPCARAGIGRRARSCARVRGRKGGKDDGRDEDEVRSEGMARARANAKTKTRGAVRPRTREAGLVDRAASQRASRRAAVPVVGSTAYDSPNTPRGMQAQVERLPANGQSLSAVDFRIYRQGLDTDFVVLAGWAIADDTTERKNNMTLVRIRPEELVGKRVIHLLLKHSNDPEWSWAGLFFVFADDTWYEFWSAAEIRCVQLDLVCSHVRSDELDP